MYGVVITVLLSSCYLISCSLSYFCFCLVAASCCCTRVVESFVSYTQELVVRISVDFFLYYKYIFCRLVCATWLTPLLYIVWFVILRGFQNIILSIMLRDLCQRTSACNVHHAPLYYSLQHYCRAAYTFLIVVLTNNHLPNGQVISSMPELLFEQCSSASVIINVYRIKNFYCMMIYIVHCTGYSIFIST